jgi:hypothetical protein
MEEKRPTDAEMDAAMWKKPYPCFNVISVLVPALMFFSVHGPGSNDPTSREFTHLGGLGETLFVVGLSIFVGLIAGIIALCRRERFWPITLLGLLLNALPIMWILFGMFMAAVR